ncbi:Predicted arabinose efflux permease, MFS family [Streptomyces sp. WMMB 714]|uniref:MFS transporter n=1 Tax=Streptomyces sp. WMMB 714 TaxID=1286822 RepID=UPI0005F81EC9|nr:MFS transporter [Streptomyces sp. WMMB 714]SCK11979.1 Predicted arabinose efflux permease, MFS family [Streptomyces sp. WMMB 714]
MTHETPLSKEPPPPPAPRTTVRTADIKRLLSAAFVGTALEWYDYFLYGTAAALVFNKLFFPDLDPAVGTIASFITFAVGFVARPIGAAIFGHIGDRLGRKTALIATVVLMGVTTGCIGLLPGYDTIGIWAPALLATLRFLQGISVGGEWSGAMLLTLEHTPKEKHGSYSAVPQLGSPVGTLLSSGAFALVGMLDDDAFYSWGWRIPFLFAFVLLFVALYMRLRIEESPVFKAMMEESERNGPPPAPLVEAFRRTWGRILIGIAAAFLGIGGFFLLTTFIISYGTEQLGVDKSVMLNATLVGSVVEIVVLVVAGRIANKAGPWKVCTVGGIVSVLAAFPTFWLVDTGQTALVILGVSLGIGAISIPYAPIGAVVSGMFPENFRYSAVAMSYNLAGVLAGFVPLVAASLLGLSGGASWSAALLLVFIAACTTGGSYLAGPQLRRRLGHDPSKQHANSKAIA